jgi:hypothetical protein
MNCEQFETIGLDLDRESHNGVDPIERAAAIDHANSCARCAALQESWRDAQLELQALRDMTADAGAPLRVEMRLRQEFFARTRAQKVRRFALASAWVLASAALLLVGMSWWNWHISSENIVLQGATSAPKNDANISASTNTGATTAANTTASAIDNYPTEPANEATLVAANDAEDFTLLPGSMAQEIGDGSVVRVRMQRGALGDLGLPVNEERANEWIQVDLLVGQDGQPQAVRLPESQ